MTYTMLGLFNLSGSEIVLILALLAMFVVAPAVLIGVIFLIIRMTRKSSACASSSNPERQILTLGHPMTPNKRAPLDAAVAPCLRADHHVSTRVSSVVKHFNAHFENNTRTYAR